MWLVQHHQDKMSQTQALKTEAEIREVGTVCAYMAAREASMRRIRRAWGRNAACDAKWKAQARFIRLGMLREFYGDTLDPG